MSFKCVCLGWNVISVPPVFLQLFTKFGLLLLQRSTLAWVKALQTLISQVSHVSLFVCFIVLGVRYAGGFFRSASLIHSSRVAGIPLCVHVTEGRRQHCTAPSSSLTAVRWAQKLSLGQLGIHRDVLFQPLRHAWLACCWCFFDPCTCSLWEGTLSVTSTDVCCSTGVAGPLFRSSRCCCPFRLVVSSIVGFAQVDQTKLRNLKWNWQTLPPARVKHPACLFPRGWPQSVRGSVSHVSGQKVFPAYGTSWFCVGKRLAA